MSIMKRQFKGFTLGNFYFKEMLWFLVSGICRMFSCTGEEVNRLQFNNGGSYTSAVREGSFEIFGDRVTKLGTNMYGFMFLMQ